MNHVEKLKPTIKDVIKLLNKKKHSIEDGMGVCAAVLQCLFAEAEFSEDEIKRYSKLLLDYWIAACKNVREK